MQKLANWSQKGAKGSPNGAKNEQNGAKLSTRSAGKRPKCIKRSTFGKGQAKGRQKHRQSTILDLTLVGLT